MSQLRVSFIRQGIGLLLRSAGSSYKKTFPGIKYESNLELTRVVVDLYVFIYITHSCMCNSPLFVDLVKCQDVQILFRFSAGT